jgi:hypothetical protein
MTLDASHPIFPPVYQSVIKAKCKPVGNSGCGWSHEFAWFNRDIGFSLNQYYGLWVGIYLRWGHRWSLQHW